MSFRDRDLQAEIEAHIEERTDELIEGGMDPREARLQAKREFGNVTLTVEQSREVWVSVLFDQFAQDLRYALRTLRRSPGFSVTATACLTLGIGATTAIFSMVYGILLKPLPYQDPQQLVAIWNAITSQKGSKVFAPYRDFDNWSRNSRSFTELAGATWATNSRMMTGRGPTQKVLVIPSTLKLFSLLGANAVRGRIFQPDDLARGCTVVLSYHFWQAALGGQEDIVGRQLRFDAESCTVIGIMPPKFAFYPPSTEAWSLINPTGDITRNPDQRGVGVFGRLKPGVSTEAAQAELKSLAAAINGGVRYGAQAEPMLYPLQSEFTWLTGRNLRTSLTVLFAAVSAVLLIACVNVANLLLGRSLIRQRELTIRAALGSGRNRLLRQFLTESLILALTGAAAGVLIAEAAISLFRTVNPIELPPGTEVTVNLPVLAFTIGLALLTTVLFGFVPAWKATGSTLNEALKSGVRTLSGSGKQLLSKALITVEVTLSLVLLVGAGLLMQSVMRFASAPLGFDVQNLSQIPISLPPAEYGKPGQRAAFYSQLLEDARVLPDFRSIALTNGVPLRGSGGSNILVVEGKPEPTPRTAQHDIAQQSVSPGYFRCMGISLYKGREFEERDAEKSQSVAVINEELQKKYFPGEDPIGKRIRIVGESEWLTVVGIASDEKRTTVYQEMNWVDAPIVYRPFAQQPPLSANLLIRTASQKDASLNVQQFLRKRYPGAFFGTPEPVTHLVEDFLKYPRFRGVLSAVFAALALLLAVVGLYGVLSQLVAQRTREIGLRMALGAHKRSIFSLILKQGMFLALAGLAAGLCLSVWLTWFFSSLLYGVSSLDPLTLAAVSTVLLAVSLLAAYIPARRAAGVDPMIALRDE